MKKNIIITFSPEGPSQRKHFQWLPKIIYSSFVHNLWPTNEVVCEKNISPCLFRVTSSISILYPEDIR